MRVAMMRDMDRFEIAKEKEYETMLMARVISRRLNLQMKIGDVEYQGDGRKATFYYTAEDRVDFRELIKLLAREFRVKIEMRQIGSRQEASRIGGIGSCGRELCCSTWLTKFKSVSTTAARYQNLAINQSKLSGQCGRLKCCLNFELNMYMEALKGFPKNADFIETKKGRARLIKTDIFRRLMWYSLLDTHSIQALNVDRVTEILEMNARGEFPETLVAVSNAATFIAKIGFEDGVGEIDLDTLGPMEKSKRRRRNRKRRGGGNNQKNTSSSNAKSGNRNPRGKSGGRNTNSPKPRNPNKNKPQEGKSNSNNSPSKNTTNKPPTVDKSGNSNTQKPQSNRNKNQRQNQAKKEGDAEKRNSRNRRNNRPNKKKDE